MDDHGRLPFLKAGERTLKLADRLNVDCQEGALRITEIRDLTVGFQTSIANAVVNFASHDVSLVALVSDVIRNGRPLVGIAFNSIGRFAQSGIIRNRIAPRISAADPDSLLAADGSLDCDTLYRVAMKDEKPGGHGDRAGAVAAVELAAWDLNAKFAQEPAYATIARHHGGDAASQVPVYAAGGYYHPDGGVKRLREELQGYIDQGFTSAKIKIGGASTASDMERIENAIDVLGGGHHLAVDVNGRFDETAAMSTAEAIAPYNLRWFEEIGDPLDYQLNARVARHYPGAIAGGENLFSAPDVLNFVRYGGMRPGLDIFQMDAGLSYGLSEYRAIVAALEDNGFDRASIHPHGGHLINLHIVCGLNLGGCEAYPNVFQPFGGYSPECRIADGMIRPAQHDGFGLEHKTELQELIAEIKS